MVNLHSSTLTVLSLTIEIEANRVKIARVETAYLHVSRWNQQLRQAILVSDISSTSCPRASNAASFSNEPV